MVAALLAEGARTAVLAFVDGDWASGLVFGDVDSGFGGVVSSPVGGGPAGVAAVGLSAGRGEGVLADRKSVV